MKKEKVTNTSVTLNITEPKHDDKSNITHYSISISNANEQKILNVSRTVVVTEALVPGLLPNTGYTVVVAAVNGIGVGNFSRALNVQTAGSFSLVISADIYRLML